MAKTAQKGATGGKGTGTSAAKPSKAGGIVTVAVLSVLALGGGGLTGKLIGGRLQSSPAAATPGEASAAPSPYSADMVLRELPPIVANLAEPAETRIRLQVAVVYAKKGVEQPDVLAGQIADDIVAFVKTVGLPQIQGASGLQALREDLADRARTRSEGKIRELMIENLVVQ